jgi:hypothetical protein
MRVFVGAMFLLLSGAAVAITPAEFIDQAKRVAASSKDQAVVATTSLADLMKRHPEMKLGASITIKTPTADSEVLPIFVVDLAQIKDFPAKGLTNCLMPTGRAYWLVYPEIGEDRHVTVSSVELKPIPGGWQTAQMGGASYAESVWQAIEDAGRPKDVILVRVPALALHFIGFVENGKLKLSLITTSSTFKDLKERDARSAEAILKELAHEATQKNSHGYN